MRQIRLSVSRNVSGLLCSRLPGHDAECDADGPAQAIWNQLPGLGDVVRCGAGPLGGRAGDAL